jgi:hypothetical protein
MTVNDAILGGMAEPGRIDSGIRWVRSFIAVWVVREGTARDCMNGNDSITNQK